MAAAGSWLQEEGIGSYTLEKVVLWWYSYGALLAHPPGVWKARNEDERSPNGGSRYCAPVMFKAIDEYWSWKKSEWWKPFLFPRDSFKAIDEENRNDFHLSLYCSTHLADAPARSHHITIFLNLYQPMPFSCS